MTDTPKFETFEELQAWLDSQNDSSEKTGESSKESSTKKKTTASSRKKKPKKPVKKDEAIEFLKEKRPDIWSSVHFYTREGDTVSTVRSDAKEEAQYRNNNVLVFYHDHIFGEACKTSCGGI